MPIPPKSRVGGVDFRSTGPTHLRATVTGIIERTGGVLIKVDREAFSKRNDRGTILQPPAGLAVGDLIEVSSSSQIGAYLYVRTISRAGVSAQPVDPFEGVRFPPKPTRPLIYPTGFTAANLVKVRVSGVDNQKGVAAVITQAGKQLSLPLHLRDAAEVIERGKGLWVFELGGDLCCTAEFALVAYRIHYDLKAGSQFSVNSSTFGAATAIDTLGKTPQGKLALLISCKWFHLGEVAFKFLAVYFADRSQLVDFGSGYRFTGDRKVVSATLKVEGFDPKAGTVPDLIVALSRRPLECDLGFEEKKAAALPPTVAPAREATKARPADPEEVIPGVKKITGRDDRIAPVLPPVEPSKHAARGRQALASRPVWDRDLVGLMPPARQAPRRIENPLSSNPVGESVPPERHLMPSSDAPAASNFPAIIRGHRRSLDTLIGGEYFATFRSPTISDGVLLLPDYEFQKYEVGQGLRIIGRHGRDYLCCLPGSNAADIVADLRRRGFLEPL